jgi:hypothetical protein
LLLITSRGWLRLLPWWLACTHAQCSMLSSQVEGTSQNICWMIEAVAIASAHLLAAAAVGTTGQHVINIQHGNCQQTFVAMIQDPHHPAVSPTPSTCPRLLLFNAIV